MSWLLFEMPCYGPVSLHMFMRTSEVCAWFADGADGDEAPMES